MAEKREKWNPLLCNYPNSEKINSVSFEAETLYTRLLAASDDNANYDGSPTLIMCGLFAKRFELGQIDVTNTLRMRDELVTAGLIKLYQVGEKTYIHIVNCKKSIRGDIKPDIRFPEFTEVIENKELAEYVTNPERIRNEIVSPTIAITTTIDSTTTTTSKKTIDEKKIASFELTLQKLALTAADELERILPTRTNQEKQTFSKVIQHIMSHCKNGRENKAESIFDNFLSLAKEAAASNAGSKKAFFVSLVKKKYGFNGGGK